MADVSKATNKPNNKNWIERIWFENDWLGYVLWPLLWPLSRLFQLISEKRKQQYHTGKKSSYRPPVPIIVVGNITAGGNGKTPMVIWLVETLIKNGYSPGVVSRGYGGKSTTYPLHVNSETPTSESGDEPQLIHKRTGAPVVVDPVRSNAVKALLQQGVDVVVTDDGLQHYALQRDIEFVIVDGERRFGNEHFMPMGPLREGIERLNSVDFVINNGGLPVGSEISMSLKPTEAVNLVTSERKLVTDMTALVAFAGIGHPPRFFNTLETLGAIVSTAHSFPDHQAFSLQDIEAIEQPNLDVIMTEKDAVKCASFAKDNWWYLPVSADFSVSDEQNIFSKIDKVIQQYGS